MKSSKGFYKDSIKNFQKTKGYFFGRFMTSRFLKSKDLEVAYKTLQPGFSDKLSLHKLAIEIVIVLSGESKMLVAGENVVLGKGDFLVIPSMLIHRTVSVSKKTEILVLKTPSVPDDKKLII